jgi:Flp pilus assembly pilin Flp
MSALDTSLVLNQMLSVGWNGKMGAQLRSLLFETNGEDVIEYALLTTFIGFAGAAAWSAMQTSLGNAYTGFNQAVWNIWEPTDPVGASS